MPSTTQPSTPLPTDGELKILQILWQNGACTVREVHEQLYDATTWGYTTVLKLLQIMHGKGLVIRDGRERTHRFAAATPPERTQQSMVSDLADRAFGGSAAKLALRALSSRPATREELNELRALLERLENTR